PEEQMLQGGQARVTVAMEFIPNSPDLGEPLDAALGPRSPFRARLAPLNPRKTSVALWTYPDSFGAYSRIKEELHKLGFSVAAWPKPHGELIGGSNHGSHSQAQ